MDFKTISAQWRAKDYFGEWRYGYLVDRWIYDANLEPHAIDIRTVGKALDLTDEREMPIYEGDTFEYRDIKWVVCYDPEEGAFIAKSMRNNLQILPAVALQHHRITGNIHD